MVSPQHASGIMVSRIATNSEGIWTSDRHFERQKEIRVYKVEELLEMV